jgi:hypothetical protein
VISSPGGWNSHQLDEVGLATDNPKREWSMQELTSAAGMSRSSLVVSFETMLGTMRGVAHPGDGYSWNLARQSAPPSRGAACDGLRRHHGEQGREIARAWTGAGWMLPTRPMSIDFARLDAARAGQGYLTLAETFALVERRNVVLDPFSLLIGRDVVIGTGNVFYPGVTIGGALTIGDENTFHSGSALFAHLGCIVVGGRNQFGEGGFTARADRPGGLIEIGDHGRYLGGVSVQGAARLGSGSQILGAIAVQDFVLAAGGSFEEPDPDARGAVLKGVGRARGLTLARGEVIQGSGAFDAKDIQWQSFYHPPAR